VISERFRKQPRRTRARRTATIPPRFRPRIGRTARTRPLRSLNRPQPPPELHRANELPWAYLRLLRQEHPVETSTGLRQPPHRRPATLCLEGHRAADHPLKVRHLHIEPVCPRSSSAAARPAPTPLPSQLERDRQHGGASVAPCRRQAPLAPAYRAVAPLCSPLAQRAPDGVHESGAAGLAGAHPVEASRGGSRLPLGRSQH
jgi:hypothetical protein